MALHFRLRYGRDVGWNLGLIFILGAEGFHVAIVIPGLALGLTSDEDW